MRRIIFISFTILICINLLYVISGVINYQVRSLDVYAIWLFKAKILYFAQGDALYIIKNLEHSHPHYPLLLPYSFYLIAKFIGNFSEFWILIFYPLVYFAILLIVYKALLLTNLKQTMAVILTYFYSMFSPLLAQAGRGHAGSADIILTLIYWIIIYTALKIKKGKNEKTHLFLIVALIMIASQVKLEGAIVSVIVLYLPINKELKLKSFLISLVPFLLWQAYYRYFGFEASFGIDVNNVALFTDRLSVVVVETLKEMVNLKNWYIFWPIYWYLLFSIKKVSSLVKNTVQPPLAIMVMIFILNYLFSTLDTQSYISSSIDRIMLQLSPFFYIIFSDKIKHQLAIYEKYFQSNVYEVVKQIG